MGETATLCEPREAGCRRGDAACTLRWEVSGYWGSDRCACHLPCSLFHGSSEWMGTMVGEEVMEWKTVEQDAERATVNTPTPLLRASWGSSITPALARPIFPNDSRSLSRSTTTSRQPALSNDSILARMNDQPLLSALIQHQEVIVPTSGCGVATEILLIEPPILPGQAFQPPCRYYYCHRPAERQYTDTIIPVSTGHPPPNKDVPHNADALLPSSDRTEDA